MAKFAYLTVQSYMESGNCESGAALLQQKPNLFLSLSWDDSVQHVEGVLGIVLRAALVSCAPVCLNERDSKFKGIARFLLGFFFVSSALHASQHNVDSVTLDAAGSSARPRLCNRG